MTTFNRMTYFGKTIASLANSNVGFDNLYIFDDCSTDKDKIEWLKNCKENKVFFSKKNKGSYLTTKAAISYAFLKTNDDFIVLFQDDIVLSKNWFKNAYEIYKKAVSENSDIAIFSLWNFNQDKRDNDYYILTEGSVGFPAVFINRYFWFNFMLDYKPDCDHTSQHHKVRHWADVKICNAAIKMGYLIAVTSRSFVDHIGDESTISDRSVKFSTHLKNFVGEDY